MSEESNYEFAAERVVLELLGRGGFDSWWYDIDRETREEIKSALAKTISNCFPPRELLADQPAATASCPACLGYAEALCEHPWHAAKTAPVGVVRVVSRVRPDITIDEDETEEQ